jgi:hypothetical protein
MTETGLEGESLGYGRVRRTWRRPVASAHQSGSEKVQEAHRHENRYVMISVMGYYVV